MEEEMHVNPSIKKSVFLHDFYFQKDLKTCNSSFPQLDLFIENLQNFLNQSVKLYTVMHSCPTP